MLGFGRQESRGGTSRGGSWVIGVVGLAGGIVLLGCSSCIRRRMTYETYVGWSRSILDKDGMFNHVLGRIDGKRCRTVSSTDSGSDWSGREGCG